MAAAALKIKTSGQELAEDLVLAFLAGESSSCLVAKRVIESCDLKGARGFVSERAIFTQPPNCGNRRALARHHGHGDARPQGRPATHPATAKETPSLS